MSFIPRAVYTGASDCEIAVSFLQRMATPSKVLKDKGQGESCWRDAAEVLSSPLDANEESTITQHELSCYQSFISDVEERLQTEEVSRKLNCDEMQVIDSNPPAISIFGGGCACASVGRELVCGV